MENNAVATRQSVPLSLDQMLSQAELFVKSSFFPKSIDTKEKACVIMMKGKELGLPFTEALSKISVIQGVAVTKIETLLGLAQSRGIIEDLKIVDSPTKCEVTIKRKGQTAFTCHFGDAEALALGLSQKDNYKKQKSTMYRWRALAMNLRVTCPDAIGGLYIEEEIAHDVVLNNAGEVTEIIHEPAAAQITDEPAHHGAEGAADLSADDLPEEHLTNFVMPVGKYAGKTLMEVACDRTPTGAMKGIEYLNWAKENWIKPDQAKTNAIITRFLDTYEAELTRTPGQEG